MRFSNLSSYSFFFFFGFWFCYIFSMERGTNWRYMIEGLPPQKNTDSSGKVGMSRFC